MKESIVLSQYTGTNTFSFTLKTQGLTYQLEKDGLYYFLNEQGESLFYLETPYAIDANEAITNNAKLTISPGKGQDQLTVTVDDQWPQQAAYPVTIDPSVINDTDSVANCSDTFALSINPSSNFYSAAFVTAGTHPTTYGVTRSFLR
jgi:hypothetical protein